VIVDVRVVVDVNVDGIVYVNVDVHAYVDVHVDEFETSQCGRAASVGS
jgi:hypothetical protein